MLSIIIFKRIFIKQSFILFLPKIFAKKFNTAIEYNHLKKYVFKHSYSFNFFNSNFSNLIFFYFSSKLKFLKLLLSYYRFISNIKYNNIYFNSLSLINRKSFFFSSTSLNTFLRKLKYLFISVIKYLYSFLRFLNNKN